MRATRWFAALLTVSLMGAGTRAAADGWDLIYPDSLEVTLCETCGISFSVLSFGLLVNTGGTNIDKADVLGATFAVTSSTPQMILQLFVADPGTAIPPIVPGEAVGSVQSMNQVLVDRILPGETFRNTDPLSFLLPFGVFRDPFADNYVGPAFFDVTMRMGGYTAMFTVRAEVRFGPPDLRFVSAARVAAFPDVTPARATTWGTLKRLYR